MARDLQKQKQEKKKNKAKAPKPEKDIKIGGVLYGMSLAPDLEEDSHIVQLLPPIFFTAFIIMITRYVEYTRPLEELYWWPSTDTAVDFFSYGKMIAILVCGIVTLICLLYRLSSQAFYIKKAFLYMPMIVYAALVIMSYISSEYKEFALLGWVDRFEGTLVLLVYILMLFYIINTVNTERDVKRMLVSVGISSGILGVLGISQGMGHDFFQTSIGQKFLLPNGTFDDGTSVWDTVDSMAAQGESLLQFRFIENEIYQTVYNVNYVAFYLTLLVPLFAMIFIYSFTQGKYEFILKKLAWLVLFGLLVYNMFGSSSAGGYLGLLASFVFGVIVLNKRIRTWTVPIVIIVVTAVISIIPVSDTLVTEIREAMGLEIAYENLPGAIQMSGALQINNTINGETISDGSATAPLPEGVTAGDLRYFQTIGTDIYIGYNDDRIKVQTFPENPQTVIVSDFHERNIQLVPTEVPSVYRLGESRFGEITVAPASGDNGENYIIIGTAGEKEWVFLIGPEVLYVNGYGKTTTLENTPSIGFENNLDFGTARGYIWSRTFPIMEETSFVGMGADTFTLVFPHNDYVGKSKTENFMYQIDLIIDKPHNMYMGMWVGTGGISVIAFLALVVVYSVHSMTIYFRREFTGFLDFAGVGIFLGIVGFIFSALVNDSSVSVMPLFYGLLGTGIAINMTLCRRKALGIEA